MQYTLTLQRLPFHTYPSFDAVYIDFAKAFDSVDAVYIDFAKAFDSVSHDKLLLKARSCGFNSHLLDWLSSLLYDRFQCVYGIVSVKRDLTHVFPSRFQIL